MRVPLGEIYHFLSTSGRGQKQQKESMRKGYKISRSKIHVHERPGDCGRQYTFVGISKIRNKRWIRTELDGAHKKYGDKKRLERYKITTGQINESSCNA